MLIYYVLLRAYCYISRRLSGSFVRLFTVLMRIVSAFANYAKGQKLPNDVVYFFSTLLFSIPLVYLPEWWGMNYAVDFDVDTDAEWS